VALLEHGHEVVVVDNHSNSSPTALTQVEKVAGRPLVAAHALDLRDRPALSAIFRRYRIDAVIHLAAMKAVAESIAAPLHYFDNNIGGTTSLLCAMREHDVARLVFSSSCAVYGHVDPVPVTEQCVPRPANPYALSTWICEQIITEACHRCPELAALSLRYFSPIGAHATGLLGEAPLTGPSNIMPCLTRVAAGRLERVNVFGGDYATADGTAVRDYVHVVDVADAHRVALECVDAQRGTGMRAFNIGTGIGTSVLDLIRAFGAACGRPVPYTITDRRRGDVTAVVADPRLAAHEWNWRTTRDLATMCRDAWRFQQLNPRGYATGSDDGLRAGD
jgi:UDP-glucose 4-epimerase